MNRQYEQRLRRLEQKQSQAHQAKKAWIPQWLSDILSEDSGLPFDTEERGLDSLRRIQKRDIPCSVASLLCRCITLPGIVSLFRRATAFLCSDIGLSCTGGLNSSGAMFSCSCSFLCGGTAI